MQVLPDGHVFVGWGAEPWFTEFAPNGKGRARHGLRELERGHRRLALAVLAGAGSAQVNPLRTVDRTGFETAIELKTMRSTSPSERSGQQGAQATSATVSPS